MALTKIVLMNEQILTIHDVLYEDDAFRYSHVYSDWIKTILNKEFNKKVDYAIKIIRPQKIT